MALILISIKSMCIQSASRLCVASFSVSRKNCMTENARSLRSVKIATYQLRRYAAIDADTCIYGGHCRESPVYDKFFVICKFVYKYENPTYDSNHRSDQLFYSYTEISTPFFSQIYLFDYSDHKVNTECFEKQTYERAYKHYTT